MKHADLNLLLHFDALMACRSLSRAAEQLGITQPAMSAALSRLRKVFGDPLFTREAGLWEPTPRAQELYRDLSPLLQRWQRATLPRQGFDPSRSPGNLTLYATDYVQHFLLPRVVPRLTRDAPHFHLRVVPARLLHGLSMLDTNHVELIAGYFPEPKSDLRTRFLYDEPAVCVVRRNHPCLRKRWNLDTYLHYGHIDLAAHTGFFSAKIDRMLQGQNRSRHIVVTLSSYLACPYVVEQSDLIATLPLSVARSLAATSRIEVLDVPLSLPKITVSLYWHERHHDDPCHAWFRQYIASVVS